MDENDKDIKEILGTVASDGDDNPRRGVMGQYHKQILGTLAGFGLFGLIFLLNGMLPGPDQANSSYERGVQFYKDNNTLDARQAFSRAIELDSTFDKAYFARAIVNWRLNDANAAIADYTSVIHLKPDEADAFYNRGLIYAARGDPERALADFDAVVRLKPADPDAYLRRATIYLDRGDFQHALAERDALVRLNDRYLPYYVDRAAVRRDAGDLDGAIADVDAAIAISSQYPGAYLMRAQLRRQKGDTDGAVADFTQAIAVKPDELRAYLGRGEIFRDTGRTDAARAELDEVIRRRPDHAAAYLQRGVLELFWLGDIATAADDLNTAIRKGIEYRNSRRMLVAGIRYAELHFDLPLTPADEPPEIAPDVPFVPSIYYLMIWRHIARVRGGQDDAAELADTRSRLNYPDFWRDARRILAPPERTDWRRVTWPDHIVALIAGEATPEIVRQAAEAAPGAYERRQRICEADFYLAEYHLLKGATDDGRKLLQEAAAGCPEWMPEAGFAKLELKRDGSQR
jgi:tetratricopeptide (TPR) repeat protein